jgi:hypothetical protein
LLSDTVTKVARVFSFIPPKKAPQPLDANLDQRLIRVGLLELILGCQHTSMWRDMAQQTWPNTIFKVHQATRDPGRGIGNEASLHKHCCLVRREAANDAEAGRWRSAMRMCGKGWRWSRSHAHRTWFRHTPLTWIVTYVGQHRARGQTLARAQGGTTKDSAFTSFYFRDTVTNVPTRRMASWWPKI